MVLLDGLTPTHLSVDTVDDDKDNNWNIIFLTHKPGWQIVISLLEKENFSPEMNHLWWHPIAVSNNIYNLKKNLLIEKMIHNWEIVPFCKVWRKKWGENVCLFLPAIILSSWLKELS